jgi:hypothetical protein
MSRKITRLNDKTLEQSILIILRDNYINNFIEEILKPECKIIPIQYINENIRLEFLKNKIEKNIIIDDKMKQQFLSKIFKKECKKSTAKIISEI